MTMETLAADFKDKATISVPSEAQDAPIAEAHDVSASSAAKKKSKKKKSASTAGKARLQVVFGNTRDGIKKQSIRISNGDLPLLLYLYKTR